MTFYILWLERSVGFDTIFKSLSIGGIGAVVTGFIGYYVGKTIESPPKKSIEEAIEETDSDLLIDDIMLDELKNMNKID